MQGRPITWEKGSMPYISPCCEYLNFSFALEEVPFLASWISHLTTRCCSSNVGAEEHWKTQRVWHLLTDFAILLLCTFRHPILLQLPRIHVEQWSWGGWWLFMGVGWMGRIHRQWLHLTRELYLHRNILPRGTKYMSRNYSNELLSRVVNMKC